MLKKILTVSVALLMMTSLASAAKIGGVEFPDALKADSSELLLNGAGIRKKAFLKIYVGGLYLNEKSSNADEIINADAPMAIKLEIVSGLVTQEKMINSLNEGMEKATNGNIDPIKAEIDQFTACFSDEIKEKDIFDMVYVPAQGVVVSKNGTEKGVIKGLPFKKAMFGIWLCDKPADKGLKKGMLGK